jgi:hypothetical protein
MNHGGHKENAARRTQSQTSLNYLVIRNQSISEKPASFVFTVRVLNNPILAPTQRPGLALKFSPIDLKVMPSTL